MTSVVDQIKQDLRDQSDDLRAAHSSSYFKFETGVSDIFLGVTVPKQRVIAKEYFRTVLPEQVCELLHSSVHEERLTALIMWVQQFKTGDANIQKRIYDLYLANTEWINNWDLVDTSARDIVGAYIFNKDQSILGILSNSSNVWERRIAVVATFYFIPLGELAWTLQLAEHYLDDPHHYIHKASGWALREVGKRDEAVLRDFLDRFAPKMPRTMLRYAIERFPRNTRTVYLQKVVH